MYNSFDKKSLVSDKVRKILSNNIIYGIAIVMLLTAFTVFSVCIESVSKLIVGTVDFNLWNLLYTVIKFLLGVLIVADAVTILLVKSNSKNNLDKSINYLELINIFTILSLIFGTFIFVVNGIEMVLENVSVYNYAKSKGFTSSQEEYMEIIIFDIFIICIILTVIILTMIKIVQFIRGIEKLYTDEELDEKGVVYLKVMLSIISAIAIGISFISLPILASADYSDIEILSYFIMTMSISAIVILGAIFVFGTSNTYKEYKYLANNKNINQTENNNFNEIRFNNQNTMFCRQCGNVCRVEARFCSNCGFQLKE